MAKAQMRYRRTYRPQLSQKKQKQNNLKRFKILFSWILFLVIAFAYIFLYSPLFKIKEIKVYNNKVVSTEEIKTFLNDLSQNIFLIKEKEIISTITQNSFRVASVEVRKNVFMKDIKLKIRERKEVGILCKKNSSTKSESSNNKCYYIDKECVPFEEAPQTSGTLILVINDFSARKIILGESFFAQKLIAELVGAKKYLLNNLKISVADFEIGLNSPNDLKVNTYTGWYILLDKSKNIKNQLEALKLVLEKKIGDNRESLKYIDLRIENRVYYK